MLFLNTPGQSKGKTAPDLLLKMPRVCVCKARPHQKDVWFAYGHLGAGREQADRRLTPQKESMKTPVAGPVRTMGGRRYFLKCISAFVMKEH